MQLLLKLMIKHGAFLLKKLSFIAVFAVISTLFLVFSSCKSIPQVTGRKVEALELLDNESSFYIAIPTAADSDLIERIIKNNVTNISDSDAKAISIKSIAD